MEGNGAEAVVPLERNKYWISKVADEMTEQLQSSFIAQLCGNMKSVVNFETQRVSTNLSTTASVSKLFTANIQIAGDVDMDGTKVGRLVASTVSKTFKVGGAH